MAEGFYPPPVHQLPPIDVEQYQRDVKERRKRHRAEIRARKRLSAEAVRIARETGDASKLRALKPLYA